MNRGHLDEALAGYSRVIASAPDLADGYVYRGMILMERGRLDRAQADLDHALQLAPRTALALSYRSRLRFLQGQLNAALVDADAAIAADPSQAYSAYMVRGAVMAGHGRLADGLAAYQQASKLEPGDPEAMAAIGLVHLAMRNPTAALEDFDKALALGPTNPAALQGVAQLELFQHRFEPAVSHFAKALENQPRNAQLLLARGHAYYLWGKMALARKDVEAALSAAPGDVRVQQAAQMLKRDISLSR